MPLPHLLLTGASGLLGGHLFEKAKERWTITAVSHTHPLPFTRTADLRERQECLALVRSTRPRVILHTAANANLDVCERDPENAEAINTTAAANLLTAAQAVKARLIFVSTDMVFDGARGPVLRAWQRPHKRVSARFEYAQSLTEESAPVTHMMDDIHGEKQVELAC